MNTKQHAMAVTYEDVQKLIYRTCHAYRQRTGVNFEDLLDIALLTFVEAYLDHSIDKGSFTTWLVNRINWRFGDIMTRAIRKKKKYYEDAVLDSLPGRSRRVKNAFYNEVSKDGRYAIKIVYGVVVANCPPGEKLKPQVIKKETRRVLRCLGWSRERIEFAFQEIKEGLSI